jgi:hypothetical protein
LGGDVEAVEPNSGFVVNDLNGEVAAEAANDDDAVDNGVGLTPNPWTLFINDDDEDNNATITNRFNRMDTISFDMAASRNDVFL